MSTQTLVPLLETATRRLSPEHQILFKVILDQIKDPDHPLLPFYLMDLIQSFTRDLVANETYRLACTATRNSGATSNPCVPAPKNLSELLRAGQFALRASESLRKAIKQMLPHLPGVAQTQLKVLTGQGNSPETDSPETPTEVRPHQDEDEHRPTPPSPGQQSPANPPQGRQRLAQRGPTALPAATVPPEMTSPLLPSSPSRAERRKKPREGQNFVMALV